MVSPFIASPSHRFTSNCDSSNKRFKKNDGYCTPDRANQSVVHFTPAGRVQFEEFLRKNPDAIQSPVCPTPTRSKSIAAPADIAPKSSDAIRKRKASGGGGVAGEVRRNQRYQNAKQAANSAREAMNQADRNLEVARTAEEFLKSKMIANKARTKEKWEEISEVGSKLIVLNEEVKSLEDKDLDFEHEVTEYEGIIADHEADCLMTSRDHANKSQRSERLQFLEFRKRHGKAFKGCQLQNCKKDELRDLFQLESPRKIAYQRLAELGDIYDDLRCGGYDCLRDELKEIMDRYTTRSRVRRQGEVEEPLSTKRRWMKLVFLEIFGLTVEDHDNWLNEAATGPSR